MHQHIDLPIWYVSYDTPVSVCSNSIQFGPEMEKTTSLLFKKREDFKILKYTQVWLEKEKWNLRF